MQKFVPRSCVGNFHNERIRSTPLHRKLTFWRVSYYLGAFGTVWMPYETRCKTAELVQKFVPRSRVGIFCNERTRSTPLDPKLPFWCVSYYLVHSGPFGFLTKLGAKRAELEQKFVPRSASEFFATNAPDPPHSSLNSCSGAFRTIWVHLGPFGCLTKLGTKRAELVQMFVPRSRVRIFCNERNRSTPLDLELMFWCVSYYLVHSGPFGCLTKLGAKRAELVQKFVP